VFILFFIGIKDCCAILVKTYGNLNCGSIEALTSAYSTAPALILPWAVGYERECKDFRAFSCENLPGRIAGSRGNSSIAVILRYEGSFDLKICFAEPTDSSLRSE